jgi:mRNA interferase MazF
MKNFDEWNKIKKQIENEKYPFFHEREIFYCRVGENIGFEQCGSGENFVRPVLILRKLNQNMFWGIPLSTTTREHKYYFRFSFLPDKNSVALISQLKLIDAKRLGRKIGYMKKIDFIKLKSIIKQIVDKEL